MHTKPEVDVEEHDPRDDYQEKEKSPSAAGHVENLAEVGKPPNPWGKGARQLYMMCVLIYLCSTMNGNVHRPLLNQLSDRMQDMTDR